MDIELGIAMLAKGPEVTGNATGLLALSCVSVYQRKVQSMNDVKTLYPIFGNHSLTEFLQQ